MTSTGPLTLACNIAGSVIPEEINLLSTYWTLWTQSQPLNPKKKKETVPVYDFNTVEDFWSIFNSVRRPSEISTRLDVIYMRSQLVPPTPEEIEAAAAAKEAVKEAAKEAAAAAAATPAPTEEQAEDQPEDKAEEKPEEVKKFIRVAPAWEDVNNFCGGEYRFNLSSDPVIAEKQWELTLLSIIGGTFPFCDEICGVWLALGRKACTTLALWKRSPKAGETADDSIETIALAWLQMLSDAQVPVTGELSYTSHQASLDAANAPKWVDPVKSVWSASNLNKQ